MTKDEALKMAIAEIEGWIDHAYGHTPEECADNKTIQACKEALEQPKQFLGMKEIPYKDWVLRFYKMPNGLWYTEGINEEWMNEMVEASKSQPAQEEVPKGVLQAIASYGLSLLKTAHGFELRKLGKTEASSIVEQPQIQMNQTLECPASLHGMKLEQPSVAELNDEYLRDTHVEGLNEYPSKQEILKAVSDAVYAQYPKKKWQGLSDADVTDLANFWNISDIEIEPFIEMVARKVKENNG